jgi:hypothetical protein
MGREKRKSLKGAWSALKALFPLSAEIPAFPRGTGIGLVRLRSFFSLGAALLEKLPLKGFVLPILDGGRLLEILALLPLADNPLFFDHALEALNGLFEVLRVLNHNVSDVNHLPS